MGRWGGGEVRGRLGGTLESTPNPHTPLPTPQYTIAAAQREKNYTEAAGRREAAGGAPAPKDALSHVAEHSAAVSNYR